MSVASRLHAALMGAGPVVTRDVDVRRDVVVRAPDGTGLLTDIYLARPGRPLPVILVRSPYGRGTAGTIARLFAERGYHAVIQSTRGTFGSGGRLDFDAEAGDGRAAADWIIRQPWSDGTIGTFGGSYLSFTQLALASTRPPQLKAMAISVWGAERRSYYEGGAFTLDRALGWAFIMENQERPLAFVRIPLLARKALAAAFGHLPLLDADTVAVGHPVGFYRDWLIHDEPGDPYWAPTDFRPILKDLGIPVTMTAGWYDMFLPQMLADYQELRDGGQDVRLRVGGWDHSSRGLIRQSAADAFDWFGTHLLGRAPSRGQSGLRVEVMGGGGWRGLTEWPPKVAVQRWHLHAGGTLGTGAPEESTPDRYTYDPADPTPAVGGASPMTGGPRDNRALEQRPDVLTYTSEPMIRPLLITGTVAAELFVRSTRPCTDFFARLCDVAPGGKSVNITDGILRLTSATESPQRISIDLYPTAHQFRPGHRIRLQVSSGAHPRYARNPGSGEPLATATTLHTAQQTVHHDPAYPSVVLLPVVP
jgi:putative CocE/NonD family hydrolase